MEPTVEIRTKFEFRLKLIMRKIPNQITLVNSIRKKVPINSLEDFVFGLVWQQFIQKCSDFNVEYIKKHSGTTTDNHLFDLAGIAIDVFQTKASDIQELISSELEKQTETSSD